MSDKRHMQKVELYTDGSSKGNPGPGGYGAVLRFTDSKGELHEKELSGGFETTTNNRMELLGVISGLEALKKPCEVAVHTDSQYIANAFNQHWIDNWKRNGWKTSNKKAVKNADLWKRLLALCDAHKVDFIWVKGHAGNELNERCDGLATSAADGELGPLGIDEGFIG